MRRYIFLVVYFFLVHTALSVILSVIVVNLVDVESNIRDLVRPG